MLLRDQLGDRGAEGGDYGVGARACAREEDRAARMMSAGLLGRRIRRRAVEPADQHGTVTERLQRRGDEREFEIAALLKRAPVTGRGPMWVPYADEALDVGRRRLRECHGGRQHRVDT